VHARFTFGSTGIAAALHRGKIENKPHNMRTEPARGLRSGCGASPTARCTVRVPALTGA
jgi:hypothetical protein